MKQILVLMSALTLLFSCAEKPDPIWNTWTVSEMRFNGMSEENMDPQQKILVEQMKASVVGGAYDFRKDGTYGFAFYDVKDSGTYRFSEDRKILYIKNAKGERDYSLVSFTPAMMEWTRSDKRAFITLKSAQK